MSPLLQRLTGITAIAGLLALSAVFAAPPVQSVPKVDLERYAGTWYELSACRIDSRTSAWPMSPPPTRSTPMARWRS